MEDFKSWSLDRLVDLWVDMTTPDFDILPVTAEYGNKKLQIEYIIMEKIGLNYKDTKVILNTKRVAVEEFRKYYYRKNREACPKPPTKKMFYDKLEETNKSLNLIKKTNREISVGTSTQIQLACKMGQKMSGIGIFLTKIMKKNGKKKINMRR